MTRRLTPVLVVIGLALLVATAIVPLLQPERPLRDFSTFIQSGRAYDQGLDPYALPGARVDPSSQQESTSLNLNPPISVYPFSLIADFDPTLARNALNLVSALIYGAVCVALMKAYAWQRRPLMLLWLLAVAAFWYTLLLGQIYIPLFALGLAALLCIERSRHLLWAGVLIGLVVAIKPNFAIWPLLLLLANQRQLALTAFSVATVVTAMPLLIEGPDIYAQWLDAARDYPRAAIAPNAAMFGVAARIGVEQAGYVIAATLVAAGGFYAWRWQLTAHEASAWGVMLTLLVGPLTWVGYTLFMLPLLLSRRWARWEIVIAATMVVPIGMGWPAGELRLAGIALLSGLVVNDTLQGRRAEIVASAEPSALATGQAA